MSGRRFNPEKAGNLISAERKQELPPDHVIEKLDLKSNDVVADLGAGVGYFTIPIAQRTKNTVYAIDIEPKMLRMLEENVDYEHITNIQVLVSDLENIQLEDQSVDKVIVAFVLHEVPDLNKALQEIKRILKPDGKALIVNWEAVEMDMGPPVHERIPSEEMMKLLNDDGCSETTRLPLNDICYAYELRTV